MKFRLISKSGDALALLLRIADEGNNCDFWVKKAAARTSYKGILSQVNDWKRGLTKDTICLFDMVGLSSIAEQLKKAGYKVFGAGKINDALELNREFGMKVAKIAGMKTPEYKKFTSFTKAIQFITDKGGAWVFKPTNNASPAFTYVGEDTEDLVEMLNYFKKIWSGKVEFVLQEKIEGTEISTECFYVDGEPVPNSVNSTLETKRFLNDDKGPNTGCSTSVAWFWKQPRKRDPKIYRLGLKKIEPFLKRFKYSGPLDVNCIVSETDNMPYFLEWTSRFGYSAIYALCEGLNMEVSKFVSDMAAGQIPELKPSFDWCGAVRVSIPPYPSDVNCEKTAGIPIRGINSLDHTWLLDCKYQNGHISTAGVDGVVMEVTGKAKTVNELEKVIYGRIAKLKIPDAQYRTDLAKNANERLDQLRKWNYFKD